ncbi:MAG: DNA alkylation repair protein [Kiritimatiellales bacterium]|jgi:3-methyladenine DNA glycosylase AlkD
MSEATKITKQLKALGNKTAAEHALRFFKTGPGQYGEGDLFLGIRVPVLRTVAKEHRNITLDDAVELLQSPLHEVRLLALLIMVLQYERGGNEAAIYRAYLANTHRINNWDLVDVTASQIVGSHLFDRNRDQPEHLINEPSSSPVIVGRASRIRERVSAQKHRLPGVPGKPVLQETAETSESLTVLTKLAKSKSLWERRIAIIATFYFIRRNQFDDTLAVADLLLNDQEDLMHKAVGWMLREVGKRNLKTEEDFLLPRCKQMPRTMLRYAIEKFPEPKRLAYLNGTR